MVMLGHTLKKGLLRLCLLTHSNVTFEFRLACNEPGLRRATRAATSFFLKEFLENSKNFFKKGLGERPSDLSRTLERKCNATLARSVCAVMLLVNSALTQACSSDSTSESQGGAITSY